MGFHSIADLQSRKVNARRDGCPESAPAIPPDALESRPLLFVDECCHESAGRVVDLKRHVIASAHVERQRRRRVEGVRVTPQTERTGRRNTSAAAVPRLITRLMP